MNRATSVPCIQFNQYGSQQRGDDLLLFAAPAKTLAAWAGIPRKAWHIRMLFQRPITPSREAELKRFWDMAAGGGGNGHILGPTAIVLALQGKPKITNGLIDLSFTPTVDVEAEPKDTIPKLAAILHPKIVSRLSPDQQEKVAEHQLAPFETLPEIEHDYVFEFALQLNQITADFSRFILLNEISSSEQSEIAQSMESLCRPAIVVDGQHRLWGAANSSNEIMLPVVGLPECGWVDQIYQFVVINETAQKVETSLLTDIFGSSLTKSEQETVRAKLSKSKVDVEGRIAAVIAGRDVESPFLNMVQLKISGTVPEEFRPYLSERTVRVLIDGSTQRHSRGWRTDDDFYEEYIRPTFPVREDWESWTDGAWRLYWIEFWNTVKEFYNEQAEKLGRKPIWAPDKQTNLTKAVTLRQIQSLFMTKCVDRMKEVDATAEILEETLGEEEATTKLSQIRAQRAIPADIEEFRAFVHGFFLDQGIPVKVFLTPWKSSLDDAQGQMELWETLETAFDRTRKGERFPVKGRIFVAGEQVKADD